MLRACTFVNMPSPSHEHMLGIDSSESVEQAIQSLELYAKTGMIC